MVLGAREGARLTLQICKYAIPALAMEAFQLPAEMSFVVHDVLLLSIPPERDMIPERNTHFIFHKSGRPAKRGP